METTETPKEVTFDKLGDAIDFVDTKSKSLQQSVVDFQQSFKELTGMDPQKQVNALDVVKICYSLYGEPASGDKPSASKA